MGMIARADGQSATGVIVALLTIIANYSGALVPDTRTMLQMHYFTKASSDQRKTPKKERK